MSNLFSKAHLYLSSQYDVWWLRRSSAASRMEEAAGGNQASLDGTLVRDPKEGTWIFMVTARRVAGLIALVLIAICIAISVVAYFGGSNCLAERSARPVPVGWAIFGATRDEGGK